jgi:large subunit ribosomal protein L33
VVLVRRFSAGYDLASEPPPAGGPGSSGGRDWKDCGSPQTTPMAKGKKKLEVVHLVCEETGDMNYTLRRKTGGEKLKVKKYSPRLRKHTVHNEKRK